MSSGSIDSIEQYGKAQRDLKSTLEKVFQTKTPTDWILMTERKSKKKEEKDKESGEHPANNGKNTAILSKSTSSNYAGNFSYYARGDGKGRADEVYNKISSNIKDTELRNFFSKYFKISSVNCNFNSKAKLKTGKKSGMSKPYAWNAHHLIPGGAFTIMKSTTGTSERIFNEKQYKLLLMSDYNVNNGNNMMALPSNYMSFFQPVHNLLQHPSKHDNYTNSVINKMKKVAEDLEELTDDLEKPHPGVEVKIAEKMKSLENKLWRLLVELGKAAITSAVEKEGINEYLDEDDKLNEKDKKKWIVTKQSASGTKYPMWALA